MMKKPMMDKKMPAKKAAPVPPKKAPYGTRKAMMGMKKGKM